jgi:hypothetical protein
MTRIATTLVLLATIAFAGGASAATIVANEIDAKGGDYSNSHKNPTVFAQDVALVTGSQNRKSDTDWLLFDGFADGTERLEFTFTNVGGDWGGLSLRLKDEAFKKPGDSWPLLGAWYLDGISDERSVTVSYVLKGYTGPIHARLDFYKGNDVSNGTGLSYGISRVGDAYLPEKGIAPAPVPLPAGGALALAGLAALAALRARRRV